MNLGPRNLAVRASPARHANRAPNPVPVPALKLLVIILQRHRFYFGQLSSTE